MVESNTRRLQLYLTVPTEIRKLQIPSSKSKSECNKQNLTVPTEIRKLQIPSSKSKSECNKQNRFQTSKNKIDFTRRAFDPWERRRAGKCALDLSEMQSRSGRERRRSRKCAIDLMLGSFENSYIPENPRTPTISYIFQTVIPFKNPTSEPSKTFLIITIR
ncbi:hypothetical protein LXL04_016530 [Taraxacum kok-saghyz]